MLQSSHRARVACVQVIGGFTSGAAIIIGMSQVRTHAHQHMLHWMCLSLALYWFPTL
jgi:hypothetical protein